MVRLISFDDNEATEAELEIYRVVVEIANRHGVDPSMSKESEEFFRSLLMQYTGRLEDLAPWLQEQIPRHFTAVWYRPKWIQGPQWPFAQGRPMIFVGQFDLLSNEEQGIPKIYHDDTSLYVFVRQGVEPVVVIQHY